jgi:hypothetical protein
MWQAIYYQQPVTFQGQSGGLMGTPRGPTSQNDPLKPFYSSHEAYHTSASVANIKEFVYSYPDIPFWKYQPEQLSQQVKQRVNNLYGGGAKGTRKRAASSSQQFFAQLTMQRGMLPLPCIVNLLVGGKLMGTVTLLSEPADGVSHGEVPLDLAPSGSVGKDRLGRPTGPSDDNALDFFMRMMEVEVQKVGVFS